MSDGCMFLTDEEIRRDIDQSKEEKERDLMLKEDVLSKSRENQETDMWLKDIKVGGKWELKVNREEISIVQRAL